MSISSLTGPIVSTGNTSPFQNSEPDAAPSIFADGYGIVDSRFVSSIGTAPGGARIVGISSASTMCAIDAFPATKAANNVVAAQGAAAPSGTVLTLAAGTVRSAVSSVPLVPFLQGVDVYGNRAFTPQGFLSSNVVTTGLALDFGGITGTTFTSATVTLSANVGPTVGTWPAQFAGQVVNKNQIVILDTTNHVQPELFATPGTIVMIANAGNAGATIPLVATVQAVDFVNHYLYLTTPALAAVSSGGIATANQQGATPGVSAYPWNVTGCAVMFDPRQALSRALQYVSTNAGDTTVTLTVRGYDVYGVPMTETITLNGTTTVNGKKAFKYIQSVTTGVASLVGNVNIGTTDTCGFPFRADSYSYADVSVADAFVVAVTGFTKADVTPVATATTGDVRGTYTLQTAANNTNRFYAVQNLSPFQFDVESNLIQQPVFGQAQF